MRFGLVSDFSKMGNSNQRRFSVGLDLGGAQISVSVYDHARRCSIPLDIDGDAAPQPSKVCE
jgi:hypothetical protein